MFFWYCATAATRRFQYGGGSTYRAAGYRRGSLAVSRRIASRFGPMAPSASLVCSGGTLRF